MAKEDSKLLGCPSVGRYSITVQIEAERRVSDFKSIAEAKKSAESWVEQRLLSEIPNAVGRLAKWEKSIRCKKPCVRKVEREPVPADPKILTWTSNNKRLVFARTDFDVGTRVRCVCRDVASACNDGASADAEQDTTERRAVLSKE